MNHEIYHVNQLTEHIDKIRDVFLYKETVIYLYLDINENNLEVLQMLNGWNVGYLKKNLSSLFI